MNNDDQKFTWQDQSMCAGYATAFYIKIIIFTFKPYFFSSLEIDLFVHGEKNFEVLTNVGSHCSRQESAQMNNYNQRVTVCFNIFVS